MLQNMRVFLSVVFVDKVTHTSEHEALCELAAEEKKALGSLHGVLVGDLNQFKPIYISQHAEVTFLYRF